MRQGRVVVARNGDAALGTGLGDLGAMRTGIFGRQSLLAVAKQCESLIGQAPLGLVVERILLHRLELPLARRMVHQRNETDLRIVFKFHEMIQHVVGRDFAAQMDAMIGAKPVFPGGLRQGVCHVAHLALLEAAILVRSHAQAIKDGGDTGGDDLRVMRLDRRHFQPADPGARRVMRFQMVGMQFDQAGDKIIAFEILAGAAGAFRDIGDLAVADQDRTVENLVLKDDAGVGENGFYGHVRPSFGGRH